MTSTAHWDAVALAVDKAGIWRCIQSLTLNDFYKTMEAMERPGLHQDVYRMKFQGLRLYVKLQLLKDRTIVHVIAFKEDLNP